MGVKSSSPLPANAQRVTQPQVGRSLAANDHFGASLLLPSANTLAVGDLDKDGQGDLLIGTPEEDVAGLANSGLVSIRYGIKVGESLLTPTGRASEAGEPETEIAAFNLAQSHVLGSGPDGPDVTVTFNVTFKAPTVGQIYQLELMATDDQGNSQGFDLAGLWAIGPFDRYLPLILKQGSQN